MRLKPYPAYRPTKTQWISQIPKGWTLSPLKYNLDFQNGDTFDSKDWGEDGIKIIRIQNLNGGDNFNRINPSLVQDKYIIAKGSLLFGWSGNRGTSFGPFLWDREGEFALNQHIFKVTAKSINKSYAFWALKAVTSRIEDEAQGIIGMVHITKGDLGAFKIPIPPVDEQCSISDFLDHETAKIDNLIVEQERLIELLQEKRQAVNSHAVTKGLNPHAPMKDSGAEWLGEVPEHWNLLELKRLNKAGSSITYGIVQAGPHQENGIPYIRTSDMSGDRLSLDTCQRTTPDIDEAYARSRVAEGDLVIAIRATVGKCLVVPKELDGANLTQGTAKFSPGTRVNSEFMKSAFASSYCIAQIGSVAKGATFLEITLDALRRLKFAIPPKHEIDQITQYLSNQCKSLDSLIDQSQKACSLLKERRSALISAAVTGQIDVRGLAPEEEPV